MMAWQVCYSKPLSVLIVCQQEHLPWPATKTAWGCNRVVLRCVELSHI